jgi:F-type H+-transporting ATPase subunit gamma
MRRAITIKHELEQIHTIEDLTGVFESIASIRIAKIRNRVVSSKDFFTELWQTYAGLRIDPKIRLRRPGQAKKNRDVCLAVTAEGKLSGSIDEQIINAMLDGYQPDKTDIVIIGSHGASRLQQHDIKATKTFPLPASDLNFNVSDIIEAVNDYNHISVFYQTYESLRSQKVARIDLITAVRDLSEGISEGAEIVSSRDYIFEPSVNEVADYMESVMMGVALIQVIMESKLAQYASRFNTMSTAKFRANTLAKDYTHRYYQAKRSESDERLKETIRASSKQTTVGGV